MVRTLLSIVIGGLFFCRISLAQISPGPLSNAHSFLEGISHCTKCHESGRVINGDKCLSCHGEIKNQIDSKQGFHFANASTSCITCHKEHLGKDAKITNFDENRFDHSKTGFLITGKHSGLPCERCHETKNIKAADVVEILRTTPHVTFLGLDGRCISCHPDKHAGTLGIQCQSCHNSNSWSPAETFDHANTQFALSGKHKQVRCAKCHTTLGTRSDGGPVLFSAKPFEDCTPCHASPHGRKFSDRACRSCHTAEGWSVVASFDHSATRFSLAGAHVTVPCVKCHLQMNKGKEGMSSFVTKSFNDCTPCHTTPHSSRFSGKECKSCHTSASWNTLVGTQFNHALTKYPLEGKHADVRCEQCHKPSFGAGFNARYLISFKRCTDCHADYHGGQFERRYTSNCAVCHAVYGFSPSTFTVQRHDSTAFSLSGAHLAIPCGECHKKNSTGLQIFHFEGFRCQSCHDDVHKGQFAEQMVQHSCAECHTTVRWKMVFFDHSGTKFPLTGKHLTLRCSDCHKAKTLNGVETTEYRGLPRDCESCHKDAHVGQFAKDGETQCVACHNPAGWSHLLFDHETQSSFHLTGAHKNVPCSGCHRMEKSGSETFVRYKPLAARCESCHQRPK